MTVTDPNAAVTTYRIDGLGETFSIQSPDTRHSVAAFDSFGNPYQFANQRSAIATYSYDSLNRLDGVVYNDGAATVLQYDEYSSVAGAENYGKGHLTTITEVSPTSQVISKLFFTYDEQGHVKIGRASCRERV